MAAFHIDSSAQRLMAKARELTGIADIVDSSIEEALTVLLDSLNTDAQLSREGAEAMEQRLLRLLGNRLRMLRDFRTHPEIDDQKITRPVIVPSLPRTGTTKLHKMLAASGDFIYLPFWQAHTLSLRTGNRNENPAQRIKEADEYIRWFDEHAPRARLTHGYGLFEAEEESLVYEHNICCPLIQCFAFVPSFLQWWATQDACKQIEFVKQGLKYLQWQFYDGDPRPWILKCPMYPGMEAVLATVFPDAAFIATHRDPVSCISSSVSGIHNYHVAYSDIERKRIVGPMALEGLAMAMEQQLSNRESRPDLKFLDLGYTEITNDAERVIEKVYAHAGMRFSDKARQAVRDWERQNDQHKLGVHLHSLDDFGLSEEVVNNRYRRYIERFGRNF